MKKCLVVVVAFMMVFSIAACGDKENSEGKDDVIKAAVINAEECGKYIKDNVEFVDFMDEVDKDIMLELYNIDPTLVKESCAYFSTGATAEEIAVITVSEGDESDKITSIKEACTQRIEAQKKSFENYVPEELAKLDKPLIIGTKNAVIMIVCNDELQADKAVLDFINK